MHGDSHDFRPLPRFSVKSFKLVHDPTVHLLGRLWTERNKLLIAQVILI
jgi:hypothetical protein